MNLNSPADISVTRPRPEGQRPVHDLTTTPLEKVRVGLIGCQRGLAHAYDAARFPFTDLVAVCDRHGERAEKLANDVVEKFGVEKPAVYGGEENSWEALVDRDDIDVVYIASPWELHLPMAKRAMESGKHAFVEVSAVTTIDECWEMVDISERTQRHCVILENCCYGEEELFVLNLVAQGVLGDIYHAECAYIHDLRETYYNLQSEGAWRRRYHTLADGNHYATHGLGPVANYLDINRGDQFSYLVSMSSPERSLSLYRAKHNPNDGKHADETYVCGDMNTTMIKTIKGLSIMVQYDVVSPRPYSRLNLVSGTNGTYHDFPTQLALDHPEDLGLETKGAHSWLSEADFATMKERYTHPVWAGLKEIAADGGHGGMDSVMNHRLLQAILLGHTPDINVYDAAQWSCIQELSALSVAGGSVPVAIPDFTRGLWETMGTHPLKAASQAVAV